MNAGLASGAGKWSVKANGKTVSLINPVRVGVTIGNDSGFEQLVASLS